MKQRLMATLAFAGPAFFVLFTILFVTHLKTWPEIFPDLSRQELIRASVFASAVLGSFFLVFCVWAFFTRTSLPSKLVVLVLCTLSGAVGGSYLWIQLLIFPDEICGDFAIQTISPDSYRRLDEKSTDSATYTLYFDRKGYAGDSPEPFVGIDKKFLREQRVRRCRHQGLLFSHFIEKEPMSGKLNIHTRTIILNYADGQVSRIKITEDLQLER